MGHIASMRSRQCPTVLGIAIVTEVFVRSFRSFPSELETWVRSWLGYGFTDFIYLLLVVAQGNRLFLPLS